MTVIDASKRFTSSKQYDPKWNPFPQDSSLYFNVEEYPISIESKKVSGSYMNIDAFKALVRAVGGRPVTLNVVGSSYNVVQNKELFVGIEDKLLESFTREQLENVAVVDRTAYYGAKCFREYILRNLTEPVTDKSIVAFRVIVSNSFGGGSLKLITGAIDSYCTNGMIIGEFATWYRRHTKGLEIGDVTHRVHSAIDMFYKNIETWRGWSKMDIKDDAVVMKFLQKNFSDRLSSELFIRFNAETHAHGRTIWALYSALTNYASHMKVSKMNNDNVAAVRLAREQQVGSITNTQDWRALLAA